MATYLPPLIYESHASSSQECYNAYQDSYSCQPATGSQYYPHTEDLSPNFLVGASALSAVSVNDQLPASHPLYGSASTAALSYTTEHAPPASNRWAQSNQSYLQTRFNSNGLHPRPPYEAGEVSPVSDDSAGTYYDSPQPYEHAQLADTYGNYYEQAPAPLSRSEDGYSAGYDYGQVSPVAYESNDYSRYVYCGDNDAHVQSHLFSADVTSSDYDRRYSPHYLAKQQQMDAPMQSAFRSASPMGHLPYPSSDPYGSVAEGYSSSDTSRQSSIERPQPRNFNTDRSLQLLAHQPPPIAIPAPRSPPIVEDTPKKPLTLACFFCRKRKIACGSPAPGKKDRTCNQCARRNLHCEYPVNSRRGTRQREGEGLSYQT